MGIFGKFFKQNIKKMEKNGDVEGLIEALKHKSAWTLLSTLAQTLKKWAEEALKKIKAKLRT